MRVVHEWPCGKLRMRAESGIMPRLRAAGQDGNANDEGGFRKKRPKGDCGKSIS